MQTTEHQFNFSEKYVNLSSEQLAVIEHFESGCNCSVQGGAGTGKSTILKEFLRRTDRNVVVVAPTGRAASNLDTGGAMTIHRFFNLPVDPLSVDYEPAYNQEFRDLIENVDTICIDEISMVRADVLNAISNTLKTFTGNDEPFGGKQLITLGDFAQLPPVVATAAEHEYLTEVFGGHWAFTSPVWQEANFVELNLEQVHRQKDQDFIDILNTIRSGDLEEVMFYETYTNQILDEPIVHEMCAVDAINTILRVGARPPKEALVLCTTNAEADRHNMEIEMGLGVPLVTLQAEIRGFFDPNNYPTSPNLVLRTGSRVMLLKNHLHPSLPGSYVNGDCGYVTGLDDNKVRVLLDRGYEVSVGMACWDEMKYWLERDENGVARIQKKKIGEFWQYPLKIANAISIHKSQSSTLDTVYINFGSKGAWCAGMAYTALTRPREASKTYIDRPLTHEDIIRDPDVMEFLGAKKKERPRQVVESNAEDLPPHEVGTAEIIHGAMF